VLFLIFTGAYLMWSTVPLSLGGAAQFDAGRLLLYPIRLLKVFVMDVLSEVSSLGSIFAIPVIMAVALGCGFGRKNLTLSLIGGIFAIIFGIALAKWLAISLGALTRSKRTRGETLIAVIGGIIGVGGAFAGQIAPAIVENTHLWETLQWTPPGVAVMAVMGAPNGVTFDRYLTALLLLTGYSLLLITVAFWVARRSALNMGGAAGKSTVAKSARVAHSGWKIPLVSQSTTGVIEKELRYAMRNAQLRMLAVIPLVFIGLKLTRTSGAHPRHGGAGAAFELGEHFGAYATGLIPALGVLYVFMLTSSLSCNSFAYEGGGMRSWILAPISRRSILAGKNLAIMVIALLYSILLLSVNEAVFRDLEAESIAYAAIAFVMFASILSFIGNWLSIYFPKRLQFGKRMNASGVTGLLILPILLAMGVIAAAPVFAAYITGSLLVKYVTLGALAVVAVALYLTLLPLQGRALAKRERDILEAVSGKDE
jgi:predicted permease